MKPSDLRVMRSRKMIKTAFLELIAEKGYNHVTIKDIAERAMINRKTFYNRYESIDALFQDILYESTCALLSPATCQDCDEGLPPVLLSANIHAFLRNLSHNRETLRILLNHVSVYVLNQQIEKCLQSYFMDKLAAAKDDGRYPENDYPYTLLNSLTTSFYMVVAKWWLTQEEYSEEQAATIVKNLIKNGFPISFMI